jgi:saccharopine dehydrogenase-like NADP-dependent oxidoreductase
VCQALSEDLNIALTIAGRDLAKAHTFAHKLARTPASLAVDVNDTAQLREVLHSSKPDLVIHTCGPFQGQGHVPFTLPYSLILTLRLPLPLLSLFINPFFRYHVAKECIDAGVNYVDLADGREFVCEIDKLDEEAKRKVCP